jgi:hypothetical protein
MPLDHLAVCFARRPSSRSAAHDPGCRAQRRAVTESNERDDSHATFGPLRCGLDSTRDVLSSSGLTTRSQATNVCGGRDSRSDDVHLRRRTLCRAPVARPKRRQCASSSADGLRCQLLGRGCHEPRWSELDGGLWRSFGLSRPSPSRRGRLRRRSEACAVRVPTDGMVWPRYVLRRGAERVALCRA